MGDLMKTKRVLEGYLCSVLMSLCESDTKNQVESMNEYLGLIKIRL